MTINVSSSVHMKPLSALYRGLNSHYADEALRQVQHTGLSKMLFPPFSYDCTVQGAMADYLAYSVLRKSRVAYFGGQLPTEEQLVELAVSGFLDVENRCRYFNKKGYIPGTAPSSDMLAPESVFQTARRKIAKLLGEFDLDEFATRIDFSSGASTRLPRRNAAIPVKFTGKPHVTRRCSLLATALLWHHEPWRLYCQERFGRESDPCTWVTVVDGSEYFTVPKTAFSLRGAAKEPELNMLCQKAIGNMLRSRLKRVRIDLNDQTYNQYLAGCGSRTGSLATIDLESASDSVSLRLVKDLLPASWYRFIEMTRSDAIRLPTGVLHTLEKVSSMGNGFTFELESLIFWALTSAVVDLKAVGDRRIGVYGDDIIVHHSCANDLVNTLAYCGFVTNVDKTWVAGPFRESCGKHWFLGSDVTPFSVKEDLDELGNRYHMVNQFNEWVYRFNSAGSAIVPSHDYIVRKLLGDKWDFVPPHMDSKTGIYPPSSAHVPGLVFSLKSSGYLFRQRLPGHLITRENGRRVWQSGCKTRAMRSTGAYLTWFLKAQAVGDGGEPSSVAIHGERVVYRFKTRRTSMWNDYPVVLPKHLVSL